MAKENRKLYPMRFVPQEQKTAWGSVRYLLADLGYIDSRIENGWFGGNSFSELMETYLERVAGDDVFEYYGLQFPVLVKELFVRGRTPLLVNIDDDAAAQRYDAFGKKALWFIRKAEKGAKIHLGFNRSLPAGEFYDACQAHTVDETLRTVEPREGACFLIRPGTVYAAEGILDILEISESSELFMPLYNWGLPFPEGEEDLLEEAFDLIDFHEYASTLSAEDAPWKAGGRECVAETLADEPEFKVARIDLQAPLNVNNSQLGSFTVYHCLSGEAAVQFPSGEDARPVESFALKAGRTLLIPAESELFFLVPVESGTVLLDVVVDKRTIRDPYLDR